MERQWRHEAIYHDDLAVHNWRAAGSSGSGSGTAGRGLRRPPRLASDAPARAGASGEVPRRKSGASCAATPSADDPVPAPGPEHRQPEHRH